VSGSWDGVVVGGGGCTLAAVRRSLGTGRDDPGATFTSLGTRGTSIQHLEVIDFYHYLIF
jgi:hypothetical protein